MGKKTMPDELQAESEELEEMYPVIEELTSEEMKDIPEFMLNLNERVV